MIFFVGAFLSLFFLYPVCIVLIRSVTLAGHLSGENFSLFLLDSIAHNALFLSMLIAVLTGFLSSLLGFIAAWTTFRYSFVGKKFLELLFLAPFFLPPFMGVIALKSIFNNYGIIPLSIFIPGSLTGIVIIQSLHLFPLGFLSIRASLEKIPYDAIEASMILGASSFQIFTRILFPLLLPSMLSGFLLSMVSSLSDVGTPLLFEFRSHIAVQIFNTVFELPVVSSGYILSLFLLCIVLLLFWSNQFLTRLPVSFDVKSSRMWTPVSLKSFTPILLITSIIFLGLFSVLPHLSLLLLSISNIWFMTPFPESYSFSSYVEVFFNPLTKNSFLISIILSVLAALIVSIASFGISYASDRTPRRMTQLLQTFAMLPLAIPGIIIGFGMVVGFAGTFFDPKTYPFLLLLAAYAIRKLPYGITLFTSAMKQVSFVFEEAATISGASTLKIFTKILFPMLRRTFTGVFVIVLLSSLFEVSCSLILPMEEKFFPIAKALYSLQSRPDGASLASAFSIVVMVLVFVGFYFAALIQKRRVSDLLSGA